MESQIACARGRLEVPLKIFTMRVAGWFDGTKSRLCGGESFADCNNERRAGKRFPPVPPSMARK
jgi:hypothetical protein